MAAVVTTGEAMILDDLRSEDDLPVIPDEWWWERIRMWRDAVAWAAYRQQLRDITTYATPQDVVFPVPPTEP